MTRIAWIVSGLCLLIAPSVHSQEADEENVAIAATSMEAERVAPLVLGPDEVPDILLMFNGMAANQRPFYRPAGFPPAPTLRGLAPAAREWSIKRAHGVLKSDGSLNLHIRGLVIAEFGRNCGSTTCTVPIQWRVVFMCTTVGQDGNGNLVSKPFTAVSGLFTPTVFGDLNIDTKIALPAKIYDPVIFITGPGPNVDPPRPGGWFAVSGRLPQH